MGSSSGSLRRTLHGCVDWNSTGSEVEINLEDDKVWIDGKENLGAVVDGSDLLTIPTGESELELYFSSWTNSTPEVTVEFEERWL